MEVPSCGTENAATAGVSAILSTGVYGVVDVDVRFDARCGFFRTGAGMCISVCGYGMDWWVVWVVGFWIREASPAENDAEVRERESEPDALSAPEGFFFRVYSSPPRSASSASPE